MTYDYDLWLMTYDYDLWLMIITCGVVNFERTWKQVLLLVEQKLSHTCRMALSSPSKEFNTILIGNLDYSMSWHLSKDASMSKLHIGKLLMLWLFGTCRCPRIFWLHLIMFTDQVLAEDNLFSEVCV